MSQIYELQKQLEAMVLQVSDIKQIPTQAAITTVTNSIVSAPNIIYDETTPKNEITFRSINVYVARSP